MALETNFHYNILNNLPQGVQVYDFNWRCIYANDTILQYNKCTKKELIGSPITEIFPCIQQNETWQTLQRCMLNRECCSIETEFILPDKSIAFFELQVNPVPKGLCIISAKKNHQSNTKQKLKAAHEELLFLVKNTPLGFIQWDENIRVRAASARTEEIFEWTIPELKSQKNIGKLIIHPKDINLAYEKIRELFKGDVDSNRVLLRSCTKSGKMIWCEWFNSALKDKNGDVITIMSLIDDVTEHKEAENKLKKVNRLFAFLSATNQTIIHTENKQELFDNIASIAVVIGGFKTAWIALLQDEAQLNMVSIKGNAHDGFDYRKFSGLKFNEPPFHETTIAKVLLTHQYAVSNSVLNDEGMLVWKNIYEKLDIKATITLPLLVDKNLVGVVGFNSVTEHFFDAEEVSLLIEASQDIAFAIHTIDEREKHGRVEKLVEDNEKRFRALIEKGKDMKALSNAEGKIIYCTPSITKMLGYATEEFLQAGLYDLVHHEDIPQFVEKRKTISGVKGASFTCQVRVKHKQGKWVWCESTLTNYLDEPGINAIVSNFTDISERKYAEQKLEFDQNNFNALINNTQDLMWSLNTDYTLITFNQPFEAMVHLFTGSTVIKGGDMRALDIPIKRLRRMESFYKRAFSGEIFTEIQYIDYPNEMWFEISFSPIYKDDEVIGAACHSRNITRRKTTEHLLRKSEAFNKGVIDSLTAHIAVIDETGNIIAVNEAWKKFAGDNFNTALLHGFLGNNYIDNCVQSALAGNSAAALAVNGITDVVNKKTGIFYFEYECNAAEKNYWFSMRVMKFENDDSMMIISQQDISLRKKAELERTDIVDALVQRNKDLEQFSYIVSHNLRAPVANIIGAAEIVNEPALSTADREILIKGLSQSSKRLDEVLKDMNYILKVRDVNTQVKEKLVLSDLFKDVTSDIHYLTDDNNIKIISDFSLVNEVYSIKTYLYSIFYNLITNSIKYRQYRLQTQIHISSKIVNNTVELVFKDNGIGINLEKKGKEVFGLYKRFHIHIEGRGMGLYLVKTQVEALGGKISLQSQENVGSEFTIELPQ